MKKYYLLFINCLIVYSFAAQTNANNCGQNNICQNIFNSQNIYDENIEIEKTYVDENNNVYMVGKFSETVDFDPNPNVDSNITSSGSTDCFLQKLDENGNYIWTRTWGGENADNALDISTDSQGNIYIVGSFYGSVDFDPSPAEYLLNSSEGEIFDYYNFKSEYVPTYDGFVLKLDNAGNFLWVNKFGAAYTVYSYYSNYQFVAGNDVISNIEIDKNDNIIVGGSYDGRNVFDGNTLVPFDYSYSYAARASFIGKIDNSNGKAIWADGINSGSVYGLEIDQSGNIIVAQSILIYEYFYGYYSFAESNHELRKFDSNGQFIWSYPTDEIAFEKIGIDSCSNVFAVGSFSLEEDFDNDTLSNFTLNPFNGDNFLLKLSEAGSFEFALQYDASESFIDLDTYGNAYVAKSNYNTNYQISKYSNTGVSIWTLSSNQSESFSLSDILLYKKNEIIATGKTSNRWYSNSCEIINCPLELILSDQIAGSIYQASNKILCGGKIDASSMGDVYFQAGDEFIELQIGFDADGSVNFTAEIFDCGASN